MKILLNLTHLLASSRPPRSLSALLTGQLWNRLIIIGPAARPVMERTWCSRCRSETASTRGSPSATCSRWTPGGGQADTAPGPRCPGTPDTRDTADRQNIFILHKNILKTLFVLYLRDVSVSHDASLLLRGCGLIGGVCGHRGAHHPATSQTLPSVILISQPWSWIHPVQGNQS